MPKFEIDKRSIGYGVVIRGEAENEEEFLETVNSHTELEIETGDGLTFTLFVYGDELEEDDVRYE